MKEAGFFRRLGAWVYDVLVVTAVLIAAGAIALGVVALALKIGLLNMGNYVDVSHYLNNHPVAAILYPLYLFTVMVGFYAYFWCKAGQTLGMRAWRLHLQNEDGQRVSLTQALVRMATSAFGLGNVTVLIDSKNRSLQDHMASTHVYFDPKVK
ncbi:RDD family protein [Thaumasiovibrio subtropicus]|uniref:RDD family protein n=1 Tax=Thaumasiovibrio subtropicus TaxID=1891207 RepID=UPI00186471FC|nr:RDD family protein [Thaumasiovibrio subtropicus]